MTEAKHVGAAPATATSEDDISPEPCWVRVALDVPLMGVFDYRSAVPVPVGVRVAVPFGRRTLIGLVVAQPERPDLDPGQIRDVETILDDVPPMSAAWMRMVAFAAQYYQRPLGEVALPALPGSLRKLASYRGKRSGAGPVARLDARQARAGAKRSKATGEAGGERTDAVVGSVDVLPDTVLNDAQNTAVQAILSGRGYRTALLHGVTGSGKTEVYLHVARQILAAGRQVLMLVPEINLTPQFEQALRRRFEPVVGPAGIAVMHSGLSEGERLQAWLAAQRGQARLVLGTRLAIFAPLQELGLIVVDEEHDASYKQQDGLRYSARDLAVWRGHDLGIPVVLGSATPALETWDHARRGRYLYLSLPERARIGELPTIRLVDTRRLALQHGLSPHLINAMRERLARQEQVLVFLNRRGYAPALHCHSCGWVGNCPRCTAYMVMHRDARAGRYVMQCHHCGWRQPVPRACPDCKDQDLQPMGRGTQRLEEHLAELFPGARVLRIDADSTRRKGSAEALFGQVHAGEVDILIGTQMVAKGHDFARLGLVGVLNADSMLFSHDFRAPERLFAQLMQVAGRAGRHLGGAEVLVQTGYPEQSVYQALLRHDYDGFADHALAERKTAGLPPYSYQALLSAEARELAQALAFLAQARELAQNQARAQPGAAAVTLYDPVPLRIVRIAHVERAQLLLESASRQALQRLLQVWLPDLPMLAQTLRVRWQIEIDPLEI